ncbi:DUF3634 family protein [Oceanisphaera avium]|uniref:DUF3634 domain-containing protein n=1 Tax=Oceanisphaera avium TaxID=1903694 RepID=A0A1Y0CZ28_9GAMM|nr:DUF3634 family protein [Oceanisphaera avium]ART80559.1 hypothetical protein CBP12_10750 [Oceanisphaera avium]
MSSLVFLTALSLFVLLYLLRRQQEVFRIRLQSTQVKVISGQPCPKLLQFCKQLTLEVGSVNGSIRGLKKNNRIELICSHSIPIAYRQDIYLFWQQHCQTDKSCPNGLPSLLK